MGDAGAVGSFLRVLAERAAADPAYLGSAVRMYSQLEGRSLSDVLTSLGVSEDTATDFLVSLRPVGERFAETLTAICARFDANETMLLVVLRQAEVLDAFRAHAGSGSHSGAGDAGLLMAARMREGSPPAQDAAEGSHSSGDDDGRGGGGRDAR